MADRHREEVILNELYPYSCASFRGTYGSCTVDASFPTIPWSYYQKSGNGKHIKTRAMDDVVTPDFKRLRSQGCIINNPMVQTLVEEYDPVTSIDFQWSSLKWGCTPGRWYNYNRGRVYGTQCGSTLTGLFLSVNHDTTSLRDQALNKAWAKIGEAEILALVTIAEFNSTIKGFVSLLKKVLAIYRAVRRGELRRLRGELSARELADLYMNARYNLRPTYYDAIGLLNALKKRIQEVPKRQTYRTQLSDSWRDETNTLTTLMSGTNWKMTTNIRKTQVVDVTVRSGVLATLDSIMKSQFFGFDQIVETAWDLVPFSFIIDWFFNVGDILSAFSPDVGVNVLASWIVETKTTIQTCSMSYPSFNVVTGKSVLPRLDCLSIGSGYTHKITTIKQRIPNYSRSVIPRFRLRIDPLKLLDLGIILMKGRKIQSYVKAGM